MQKLTKYTKKAGEKEAKWFLIDATNVRLGKLATKSATLVIGKEEVDNTDYQVSENNIVIINTDKVSYHPTKAETKMYYRHSGFPGGFKQRSLGEQMKLDSRKVVEAAISGMLPKNRLRDKYLAKVRLYKGAEHDQEAQKPVEISIK